MSHKLVIHSFICLFTFLIYFQACIYDNEIPLVIWTQLLGGIKNTNKSGYLWHFKSSFHNLQHCRKLSRPGFNPNGALWRCWCIVFSADHLFLMAKQRQNEKAPVCGGTNHAENLFSAPSRHLFSTTVSVSDSLWRFSSKPFQPPYFPTVNCFTSPEPNYGFHTFSLSCRLFSFHIGSTS